ncbi:hypothetical protein Dalk_3413 [Desulfatibacillum aliphaticivorans]|uniref:Cache domain-containing protein n=1 Tax=Desulfatibacillum aliphaticivorans TaxID=218208 RepID=B8FLF5_DESAL|nr:hypothetical protein [Desulfatibacillum aliphaticivorans]ACL05101.1 hypothetical protein Dalk_3413 [Desulfatibacillum aliphaticivorans]
MTLQANLRTLIALAVLVLFCASQAAAAAGPPCQAGSNPPPCFAARQPNAPPCLKGSFGPNTAQIAQMKFMAESVLAAYASQADVRLEAVLQNLKTLSLTPQVRSGDWKKMQGLISAFQEQNPQLLVFYINPDGSYYTAELGLTGKNLSDRAYFPGLMKGDEVVGSIVVGKTSGKKSFIVGAPVTNNGAVTGAVGAAIYAENFAAAMENAMPVPDSMVIVAVDKTNVLALCSGLDQRTAPPCRTTGVLPCLKNVEQQKNVSVVSSLTGWKFTIVGPGCPDR